MEAFVRQHEGSKAIHKVLIANNGIAAVKAIRSIRKFCYEFIGDEHAVQFVVMATPEDMSVNAEFIRMSNEIQKVPGGSNKNNYANVELIIDIAEKKGVQAVWAGWGHASENPKLPRGLAAKGIIFMGPPARAMHDLGDKIAAHLLAQTAGVKCLPWSGSGLTCEYADGVPQDKFDECCVTDEESAMRAVKLRNIPFPLMVKASEGGGGKGVRKVNGIEDLASALKMVQAEVVGSPVFLMAFGPKARHLEVQLLADQHGNAISLYGRDCTVQRRYQKVMEEGPVVAAPQHLLREMEGAAVRLAKTVGYEGVGTVEYLFVPAQNPGDEPVYSFLELNPRLQVEHPVTEQITGVNLPACQLLVACGIPLYNIPYIRKFYDLPIQPIGKIDFDTAQQKPPRGHILACRITAENAAAGFQPTGGSVKEIHFRSANDVWGYFSVASGGGVHDFSDSQFGHVFANGETRDAARKSMILALKEISIRGEIHNPVEYLIMLLETEALVTNNIHTLWLDEVIQQRQIGLGSMAEVRMEPTMVVLFGALYRSHALRKANKIEFDQCLEKGQAPPVSLLASSSSLELLYEDVKYSLHCQHSGDESYILSLNGSKVECEVQELGDDNLMVVLYGKVHVVFGMEEAGGLRLVVDSKTFLLPKEYDPTRLTATSSGKLVRFLVESGDHVDEGQSYAEIEVMKMYLPLTVPESGIISAERQPGTMLAPGDLIGSLMLDDPSKVRRAVPFTGQLEHQDEASSTPTVALNAFQKYQEVTQAITARMQGYESLDPKTPTQLVADLFNTLNNPALPSDELDEVMAAVRVELPASMALQVDALSGMYRQVLQASPEAADFQAGAIAALVENHINALRGTDPTSAAAFEVKAARLITLVKSYEGGLGMHTVRCITRFLQMLVSTESHWSGVSKSHDMVTTELKEHFKGDLAPVHPIMYMHEHSATAYQIVGAILDVVSADGGGKHYMDALKGLSDMGHAKAKQLLLILATATFAERSDETETRLAAIVQASTAEEREKDIQVLSDNYVVWAQDLFNYFVHANASMSQAAMEVYINRVFAAYTLTDMESNTLAKDVHVVSWTFNQGSPTNANSAMKRGGSYQRLQNALLNAAESKTGLMVVASKMADFIKNMAEWKKYLSSVQAELTPPEEGGGTRVRQVVMSVVLMGEDEKGADASLLNTFTSFLKSQTATLRDKSVLQITLIVPLKSGTPLYYTFNSDRDFDEDMTYRHIEPSLGYLLEVHRLNKNYDIQFVPTVNTQVHMYHATQKSNAAERIFVRALVVDARSAFNNPLAAQEAVEASLVEAENALEVALIDYKKANFNNIFLNIVSPVRADFKIAANACAVIADAHIGRLISLKASSVELRFLLLPMKDSGDDEKDPVPIRIVFSKDGDIKMHAYYEVTNTASPPRTVFQACALDEQFERGPLDGMHVSLPVPGITKLQVKRGAAMALNVAYAYDCPSIFKRATIKVWKDYEKATGASGVKDGLQSAPFQASSNMQRLNSRGLEASPGKSPGAAPNLFGAESNFISFQELALDPQGSETLVPVQRPAGENNVGMVVWQVDVCTPEHQEGRSFIFIVNDRTFVSGSFGPQEDLVFYLATKKARAEGIPRVYFSTNSGARIGVAQEIKEKFRVAWKNDDRPSDGYEYLYLTDEDHKRLEKAANCEKVQGPRDEIRWKIKDIIGLQDGLGVECLKGSGLIAGETSAAYNDIFTISYVPSMAVGIGAYLVRLGQRVIQKNKNAPLLLTGKDALNKLLGKSVYTSNDQLGGVQVMHPNGVSHLMARTDDEAACQILQWLSYVPKARGEALPIYPMGHSDVVERPVAYMPPQGESYDPRLLLTGEKTASGFKPGLFDNGSFMETLAGWAKGVVCGRGRLGGIPMGAVIVETRVTEKVSPADPGSPDSSQHVTQQAGQVWFPDSAFKTSQAIKDFDQEGLPLLIVANWRGFSGGSRDMHDEVLKFGSFIVDQLRVFNQPAFIYIPPYGELRGGAWVVVDPSINEHGNIEMFADPLARGGVLEPSAIVEIKYRVKDQLATMRRLYDDGCMNMAPGDEGGVDAAMKKNLPLFTDIATTFADLHDTPGRMLAKEVISAIVPWASARVYFHARLSRRLEEALLRKQMMKANSQLSRKDCDAKLTAYIQSGTATGPVDASTEAATAYDRKVSEWLSSEKPAHEKWISAIRTEAIVDQVSLLASENQDAVVQGALRALRTVDPERRAMVVEALKESLGSLESSN